MQDVFYIEDVEQALMLLKPQRLELLKLLDEPRTCPELADYFGESAQKIYYHVKSLEKAGLVEKTDEKRVRGVVEGYYQARARSYWLAPQLVGKIGSPHRAQDQMSMRVLLDLTEAMHDDIGRLANHAAETGQHMPTLSLSAHIHLPDAGRRADFMRDVQAMVQDLARKYGLPDDDIQVETDEQGFRLAVICYPRIEGDDSEQHRPNASQN